MNNIRNQAIEIVNEHVIYKLEKGTTYGEKRVSEKLRMLCLNFICEVEMYNLSEQTNYGQIVQIGCFRFVAKQQ
jgi:hypothetical protein